MLARAGIQGPVIAQRSSSTVLKRIREHWIHRTGVCCRQWASTRRFYSMPGTMRIEA